MRSTLESPDSHGLALLAAHDWIENHWGDGAATTLAATLEIGQNLLTLAPLAGLGRVTSELGVLNKTTGELLAPNSAVLNRSVSALAVDGVNLVGSQLSKLQFPIILDTNVMSANGFGAFKGVQSIFARVDRVPSNLAVEGVALREGQAAASGMHAHHVFSQAEEFSTIWNDVGMNIEQFRVQLTESTHLGQLHSTNGIPGVGPGGLWNETWRQYFLTEQAAGRQLTYDGVLNQGLKMLQDFQVPYYSPLQ